MITTHGSDKFIATQFNTYTVFLKYIYYTKWIRENYISKRRRRRKRKVDLINIEANSKNE
jgi:hypothetical protein